MDKMIRDGLGGYLSARTGHEVTVTGLNRPTATGFSAETVIVDIAEAEIPDADQGAVLPDRLVVQAAPVGPALFADYDLGRTFAVQQALAQFDVPVARMHWLCEDTAWIGTPFYVMEFVEGRVPPDRPPYHVEGWLFDSVIEERVDTWNAGIDALGALHSVPVDGFAFLSEGTQADAAGQRLKHWRRFGSELGLDAEPALLAGLDVLEQCRPPAGPLRVHWGDAKLGNMIFDSGRAAAILDWELCGLSVAEEDLAHWMAVDWMLSTGIGFERLEGLPAPAQTIARYESITGRAAVSVDWWFVFALVRMGLIFQRAAVQSRRRRGGEGSLRPNALVPHLERLLDGSVWTDYGGN